MRLNYIYFIVHLFLLCKVSATLLKAENRRVNGYACNGFFLPESEVDSGLRLACSKLLQLDESFKFPSEYSGRLFDSHRNVHFMYPVLPAKIYHTGSPGNFRVVMDQRCRKLGVMIAPVGQEETPCTWIGPALPSSPDRTKKFASQRQNSYKCVSRTLDKDLIRQAMETAKLNHGFMDAIRGGEKILTKFYKLQFIFRIPYLWIWPVIPHQNNEGVSFRLVLDKDCKLIAVVELKNSKILSFCEPEGNDWPSKPSATKSTDLTESTSELLDFLILSSTKDLRRPRFDLNADPIRMSNEMTPYDKPANPAYGQPIHDFSHRKSSRFRPYCNRKMLKPDAHAC